MNYTVDELAAMIDHSLLHPTMTDDEMIAACSTAKSYRMATVCVKPYFVKKAYELVRGSNTKVCSVIGFPHGNNTTRIKVLETRQAIKDGALEIDMVVHAGKVLGKEWAYIRRDINAVNKVCKKHSAILKVIFETDFIPDDKAKIKLCKICSRAGVAFVKTSTGYGFVKLPSGDYNYKGATTKDVMLLRKYCAPEVQIKAAGGIRTLDDLLQFRTLGVTRVGATASAAMLEEAKRRLGVESIANDSLEIQGY